MGRTTKHCRSSGTLADARTHRSNAEVHGTRGATAWFLYPRRIKKRPQAKQVSDGPISGSEVHENRISYRGHASDLSRFFLFQAAGPLFCCDLREHGARLGKCIRDSESETPGGYSAGFRGSDSGAASRVSDVDAGGGRRLAAGTVHSAAVRGGAFDKPAGCGSLIMHFHCAEWGDKGRS